MNKHNFADLHCHLHLRSYLWLCCLREELKARGEYHPWHTIPSDMQLMEHAPRAAGFSQSDLVMLWNSDIRLVFNSLYPIERGFFMSAAQPSKGHFRVLRHTLRWLTHHRLPVRRWMQRFIMRIPDRSIRHIQSPDYDYWQTLQDEYAFLLETNGKLTKNKLYNFDNQALSPAKVEAYSRAHPEIYHAEGIYTIPQDHAELEKLLSQSQPHISMILTIEGGHIFEGGRVADELVLQRIQQLKHWQHPVFFITIAHHFYNHLCGHARSFPDKAIHVLNQDEGLNEGFSDLGWAAVRALLGINTQNEKDERLGYRIFIDLKHTSAKARKQYYEQIVAPCLAKGDAIPVVVSHGAYSGRKSLQEMIDNTALEGDNHRTHRHFGTFYSLNMNSCDEDIHWIFKTKGIFGLVFERRVLGVATNAKVERKEQQDGIRVLWNNLRAVVETIYESEDYTWEEKHGVWDIIALGTDFDGYIEPVKGYKTVFALPKFRADLIQHLQKETQNPDAPAFMRYLQEVLGIENAVQKLCYDNAEAFVRRNYR